MYDLWLYKELKMKKKKDKNKQKNKPNILSLLLARTD